MDARSADVCFPARYAGSGSRNQTRLMVVVDTGRCGCGEDFTNNAPGCRTLWLAVRG
ncbi:hypothetical protein KCP73_00100 [Salmonella enterica subsp. enterica]|nr:hypothetical protein KCP73_00100 [Salmonella enterica subsp. enterica]